MLESEVQGLRAVLNSTLARAHDAPLALPERLRPVPPPVKLQADTLLDRLRDHNPELFAESARIVSAESNRELTYKNRYPDFALGVTPIQMGSKIGEWNVMLEMTIPFQQESRRWQEREAESMVAAARSRKEAAVNRLTGELFENLAGLQAAQRIEILSATSLLPQAEATLHDSSRATRQGGSGQRFPRDSNGERAAFGLHLRRHSGPRHRVLRGRCAQGRNRHCEVPSWVLHCLERPVRVHDRVFLREVTGPVGKLKLTCLHFIGNEGVPRVQFGPA